MNSGLDAVGAEESAGRRHLCAVPLDVYPLPRASLDFVVHAINAAEGVE